MNETERRKLWFEARAALRLGGDYPDWPDRLALLVIARLHDPKAWGGMLAFLEAAAEAGRLPTETIEWQTQRPARRVSRSSYLSYSAALQQRMSAPPITHQVRNAGVADVAGAVEDMEIGRFLAAWIAPYRTATAVHQEEGQNRRRKSPQKKKCDFVAEVVGRIRDFHAERDKPFDSEEMPGDAGDLLWLMKRLYPKQFEEMEGKTFQDHYRGVCSWHRAAGHQEGAKSLYLEIFPKAKSSLAGVVPIRK
ncbi:hypothetical protein [Aromatoleum anaerobium]|uniref:Replication protein n=1 Tax=Aromatoleum anaerobium TaxID=182180 RepID=A0ABX1PNP3_9RHOO|nr:hypothetical protein [Aromatoleum anaerobium]MCK0507376.1 hypothetical protein [Aromatoleum anaerobium]